ncbi:type II toxin-antitoxin system death-on-curing family toxin [soil metagenome]
MVEYLNADDLVEIHPEAGPGIRDWGLLEMAAARPASGFGDVEVFAGAHEKAAALLHGIAHLHPFVDGNKRAAWLAANVFLFLNGWMVEADEEAAFEFMMGVAAGGRDVPEITKWLQDHSRPEGSPPVAP